jgi:hypothetical protein
VKGGESSGHGKQSKSSNVNLSSFRQISLADNLSKILKKSFLRACRGSSPNNIASAMINTASCQAGRLNQRATLLSFLSKTPWMQNCLRLHLS